MTQYNNPLYVVRSPPQAVLIDIPVQQEHQPPPQCRISVLKLFLCNALAVLIIVVMAVCAGYFINNRSFSDWDGIVFVVLSVICILYVAVCACASCIHYICYQGQATAIEPV